MTTTGEPRYDLAIIPRLASYLPQDYNRVSLSLPLRLTLD